MGYVITIVVGLIGALLAMTAVGLFLPRDHSASGSAEFAATPESLFAAAVGLQNESEVKTRVVDEMNGVRRVTEVIEEPGAAFGGRWTLVFEPCESGTRLTITENGHVYNPLFRFLARFTFGHKATLNQFLKSLQSRITA